MKFVFKFHNLQYASPNILKMTESRRRRRVGHVERMGELRKLYKILVAKHEKKSSLGRTTRR
jgi:hypothetical protein